MLDDSPLSLLPALEEKAAKPALLDLLGHSDEVVDLEIGKLPSHLSKGRFPWVVEVLAVAGRSRSSDRCIAIVVAALSSSCAAFSSR